MKYFKTNKYFVNDGVVWNNRSVRPLTNFKKTVVYLLNQRFFLTHDITEQTIVASENEQNRWNMNYNSENIRRNFYWVTKNERNGSLTNNEPTNWKKRNCPSLTIGEFVDYPEIVTIPKLLNQEVANLTVIDNNYFGETRCSIPQVYIQSTSGLYLLGGGIHIGTLIRFFWSRMFQISIIFFLKVDYFRMWLFGNWLAYQKLYVGNCRNYWQSNKTTWYWINI